MTVCALLVIASESAPPPDRLWSIDELLDPSDPQQFLLAFAVLWVLMSYVLAMIGGWARLAEDYRANSAFEGQRWRFQSASMRLGTGYSNVLTVGAGPEGMSLEVFLLFRIGHPPLLIPWSDIVKRGEPSWFKGQVLVFAKAPEIKVRFSKGLVKRIEAARGKELPAVP